MKKYNSFEEERDNLFDKLRKNLKENDIKNLNKSKGCDGIHTEEEQRIWKEFNRDWQKIAEKWEVELKPLS